MAIEIDVAQLKLITDRIFESLSKRGGAIVLDWDDYWEVSPDSRYNLGTVPSDLTVGKLSDDLAFLSQVQSARQETVPYMFVHLAPLLSAIAEASVPQGS